MLKCTLAQAIALGVFQVLAEPRRREVLRLVADRERTAGEIAARFDVTRQAVSQHPRVLLEAGLISERREGARRWYRARPEGLDDVRAYVETYRRRPARGGGRRRAGDVRLHLGDDHRPPLRQVARGEPGRYVSLGAPMPR